MTSRKPLFNKLNPAFFKTLVIGVSALLLAVAIGYFTRTYDRPAYKIFDLKDRITWREDRSFHASQFGRIRRIIAIPRFEPVLLSNKAWQDFDLSFTVTAPHVFVFIYNFHDYENASFLHFDTQTSQAALVHRINGQPREVQHYNAPLKHSPRLRFQLKGRRARLWIDGKNIFDETSPNSGGRFGIEIRKVHNPRTHFFAFLLTGVTTQGRHVHIKDIGLNDLNLTPSIVLMYLLGLLLVCAIFYPADRFKNALQFQGMPTVIAIMLGALGALIFTRAVQVGFYFPLKHLKDIMLWQALAGSAVFYGAVSALAFIYSRIVWRIPMLTLFAMLLPLFYFLHLINLLTLNLSDTAAIRTVFILLAAVPAVFKIRKIPALPAHLLPEHTAKSSPLAYIVIGLWIAFALIYSMDFNFSPHRIPYVDEALWTASAQNMITLGVRKASSMAYPGWGLHSYGVPFVSSLPANFFGNGLTHSVYFMPLVFIAGIGMMLGLLRKRLRRLLFFLAAFFISIAFNQTAMLLYRTSYGEGLCVLAFLGFTLYVMHCRGREVSVAEFLLISLGIGLMALTKSPSGYFTIVFWILCAQAFVSNARFSARKVWALAGGLALLFLPIAAWKMFSMTIDIFVNRIAAESVCQWRPQMLKDALLHYVTVYPKTVYFTAVSLVLIIWDRSKNILVSAIPAIMLTVFVIIYYGWIYQGEDARSIARYLLPAVPALYYLGACAFDHLTVRAERLSRAGQIAATIAVILLFLIPLFLPAHRL